MVQLHAVRAGLPPSRATVDVDMVLHIETGSTTFGDVRRILEKLSYDLVLPNGDGPVHRFERGDEQVDVMVADNLAPKWKPKVQGTPVFAVPGGTSALRKTVSCDMEIDGTVVRLSVPDVLGALVLKGAAYKEDTRDRDRHLDDAAVLACAIENPMKERKRMVGSDRGRVTILAIELEDVEHRSWHEVPAEHRARGHQALQLIVQNPDTAGPRPGALDRLGS